MQTTGSGSDPLALIGWYVSLEASSPIWASETSLARTRERAGRREGQRKGGPSLARSREARFACPNIAWDHALSLSSLNVSRLVRPWKKKKKHTHAWSQVSPNRRACSQATDRWINTTINLIGSFNWNYRGDCEDISHRSSRGKILFEENWL